mmetsp:Transcript_18934/g.54566  ORF Transcript_18934/g.54566 Transcript_18934/m.54566 type:complete len:96 (+) Transcript_18934:1384-1671(+)
MERCSQSFQLFNISSLVLYSKPPGLLLHSLVRRLSEHLSTVQAARSALLHGPKPTRRRRPRGLVVVAAVFLPRLELLGQSSDDMLLIFHERLSMQ